MNAMEAIREHLGAIGDIEEANAIYEEGDVFNVRIDGNPIEVTLTPAEG